MIIEFSRHKDSTARGRNGDFIPAEAHVNGYRASQYCVATVYIEVDSKQVGSTSPIKLRLTLADATKLQKAIAAAVKEAK